MTGHRTRTIINVNDAAHMSDRELLRVRLDADAQSILEDVMHRSRWRAADRDALSDALHRIVARESRLQREADAKRNEKTAKPAKAKTKSTTGGVRFADKHPTNENIFPAALGMEADHG